MNTQTQVEAILAKHGYTDFRWIDPKSMVVAQWVRMKCMFGCSEYGKNACCPPNTFPVSECRKFFDEYGSAVILHFEKTVDKPEDRGPWAKQANSKLLEVEREVFLSGYQKAFLLVMDSCRLCVDCAAQRVACKNQLSARPGPEAMSVDVFATARQCGYPIEVLSDYAQAMNRYAFLLIE